LKIPPHLRRRVIDLFEQMDSAYDDVARQSGFVCNGCKDNCCMTRFFHHTLLEYLYLKDGLTGLEPEVLGEVKAQAQSVVEQTAAMEGDDKPIRMMCPLNEAGRCILYAHRPMICRLHGIAHMLQRPDGQTQTGPGCDDFYIQSGPSPDLRLDRTPLYVAMAKLERELRETLGFNGKIKMTIAEMIIDEIPRP
jgi:Fe-S-cluster containining protein